MREGEGENELQGWMQRKITEKVSRWWYHREEEQSHEENNVKKTSHLGNGKSSGPQ